MKEKLRPLITGHGATPGPIGAVRAIDFTTTLRSDLLLVQNLLDAVNKCPSRSPECEEICRYITTVDGSVERQFEAVCLLLQKLSECANVVLGQEFDESPPVTRPASALSVVRPSSTASSRPGTAASAPSHQSSLKSFNPIGNIQPIIRLFENVNRVCDHMAALERGRAAAPEEAPQNDILSRLLQQQAKLQEQIEQKFLPALDLSGTRPPTPLERVKQRKLSEDRTASRPSSADKKTPVDPKEGKEGKESKEGKEGKDLKDTKASAELKITTQVLEKVSEQRKHILELEAELETAHSEAAAAQKEASELSLSLKEATAKLKQTSTDFETISNSVKNFKNYFYGMSLYGIDVPLMKALGIDIADIPVDLKLPEKKEDEITAPIVVTKKPAAKADKKKGKEDEIPEENQPQTEKVIMQNAMKRQREILEQLQKCIKSQSSKFEAEVEGLRSQLAAVGERERSLNEVAHSERVKHAKEVGELRGEVAVLEGRLAELQSRLSESISCVVGQQSRIITKDSSVSDTNGIARLQQLVKEKDRFNQVTSGENASLKAELTAVKARLSTAEAELSEFRLQTNNQSSVIESLEKQIDEAYAMINSTSDEAQKSYQEREAAQQQSVTDKDTLRRLNMDLTLTRARLVNCNEVEKDLILRSNADHQKIARLTGQLEEERRVAEQLRHELRNVRAECEASIEAFRQAADEERSRVEGLEQRIAELGDVELNYHKLVDDFENFAKVKYDNLAKMEQEDKELAHIELLLSTGGFNINHDLTEVIDVERQLELLNEEMKRDEQPQRWMSMRKRLSCNLIIVLHKLLCDAYTSRINELKAAKQLKETKEDLSRVMDTNLDYQTVIAQVRATVEILGASNQRKEKENAALSEQLKAVARRVLLLEDTEKQLNTYIDDRDKQLSELTASNAKKTALLASLGH